MGFSLWLLCLSVNGEEVVRLQACAPDKTAIYILYFKDFSSVTRLHAATIEQRDLVCAVRAESLGKTCANSGMDLVDLVRRGHFACADGPDWLIRDHDLLGLRALWNGAVNLAGHEVQRLTGLALVQSSPMQIIGVRPARRAAAACAATISLVSP